MGNENVIQEYIIIGFRALF